MICKAGTTDFDLCLSIAKRLKQQVGLQLLPPSPGDPAGPTLNRLTLLPLARLHYKGSSSFKARPACPPRFALARCCPVVAPALQSHKERTFRVQAQLCSATLLAQGQRRLRRLTSRLCVCRHGPSVAWDADLRVRPRSCPSTSPRCSGCSHPGGRTPPRFPSCVSDCVCSCPCPGGAPERTCASQPMLHPASLLAFLRCWSPQAVPSDCTGSLTPDPTAARRLFDLRQRIRCSYTPHCTCPRRCALPLPSSCSGGCASQLPLPPAGHLTPWRQRSPCWDSELSNRPRSCTSSGWPHNCMRCYYFVSWAPALLCRPRAFAAGRPRCAPRPCISCFPHPLSRYRDCAHNPRLPAPPPASRLCSSLPSFARPRWPIAVASAAVCCALCQGTHEGPV